MGSGKRLIVYGAGGHGKVVADAAVVSGWQLMGVGDADRAKDGTSILGVPVRACEPEEAAGWCNDLGARIVVAIGSNDLRAAAFDRLRRAGAQVATIVHPRSVVAGSASVGAGSVVFAGVVINADATVGENVIVNTSCSIDHDCVIGAHAHICPGARLGGTVTVGEGTQVGIGATLKNNITVGRWTLVGAGSVVVGDVPDQVVAYGVPARPVRPAAPRRNPPE